MISKRMLKSYIPTKIDIWFFFHRTLPAFCGKVKKAVKITSHVLKGMGIGAWRGAKNAYQNFEE